MPHVKLEYTENVNWKSPIQDIFPKLQTVLIQHAGVKPENCKHRATQLKDYFCTIGGSPGGFIHLEIILLSGRSKEVKTNIGEECSQIIQSFIENSAEIHVSVELRDMDSKNYFTTTKI
ncbi:MAG: hypothetical protein H8E85_04780 [Candidatus Marinimicrobia bacterium]|nr:hypothetical protein [Candidatus Neomarinimicrobiota bacterium]